MICRLYLICTIFAGAQCAVQVLQQNRTLYGIEAVETQNFASLQQG